MFIRPSITLGTLLIMLTVLHHESHPKATALFSPNDNPESQLIGLIRRTHKEIRAAVYTITNKHITDALIAAHKRGTRVTLITDCSTLQQPAGKIDALKNAGIEVLVFKPRTTKRYRPLMHNKFALFTCNEHEKWLWTGSFNWTRLATTSNHENVILSDDASLINQYERQFERLKGECSKSLSGRARKTQGSRTKIEKIKTFLRTLKEKALE